MAVTSLGRIAGDFIASALLFREAPEDRRLDFTALRNHLLSLLDGFMRHPLAVEHPEEAEQARFALVAMADEMIIVSDWSQREQWRKDSLQLALYQTNRAGEEFYDHLSALRPEQVEAREVYYLCLALGFEGRYAGRPADRSDVIRQQLEMLRAAQRSIDLASARPLAPAAYEVGIEIRSGGHRRLWPVLMGLTTTVAAVYAIGWVWLRWLADGVPTPPEF